jgi:carbon-monoxide dehydrogenase medium subunit
MDWQTYLRPTSMTEALDLLAEHTSDARLIAGGTDVLVELPRGVLPTRTLIDLTAIPDLKYIRADGDEIRIGALATHNDVLASSVCQERLWPLVQACAEVGAPQIRTRATLAGNLVTASPANDTITPLMALEATLVLASRAGERIVPLREFYRGVRKTMLQPGELLSEICVPAIRPNQRGLFLKLGLRRAQAISVINTAVLLTLASDTIQSTRITLGCVAPTIVHAASAEAFLTGRSLDDATCAEAGRLASQDCAPIGDIRGSAIYRKETVATLVADTLRRLAAGHERPPATSTPVLLETASPAKTAMRAPSLPRGESAGERGPEKTATQPPPLAGYGAGGEVRAISTTINGQPATFAGDATRKTLLNLLRENAGLTGTKEGCAEGECGACTVWLNSQAVMSCLVPAAQAHDARITTIEGLAETAAAPTAAGLHPLQAAFIACGAVQCGYCIPGMLMAGAKLLDEHSQPDLDQIQTALSGNICRCTGYRKIAGAMLAASHQQE